MKSQQKLKKTPKGQKTSKSAKKKPTSSIQYLELYWDWRVKVKYLETFLAKIEAETGVKIQHSLNTLKAQPMGVHFYIASSHSESVRKKVEKAMVAHKSEYDRLMDRSIREVAAEIKAEKKG